MIIIDDGDTLKYDKKEKKEIDRSDGPVREENVHSHKVLYRNIHSSISYNTKN